MTEKVKVIYQVEMICEFDKDDMNEAKEELADTYKSFEELSNHEKIEFIEDNSDTITSSIKDLKFTKIDE